MSKYEIFDRSDFHVFYPIKYLVWEGDFGVKINFWNGIDSWLRYLFIFWGNFRKLSLIYTVINYRGLSLHFNTVLFTYGRYRYRINLPAYVKICFFVGFFTDVVENIIFLLLNVHFSECTGNELRTFRKKNIWDFWGHHVCGKDYYRLPTIHRTQDSFCVLTPPP